MDAVNVALTYEDYAALPADGKRYEIHEGELAVTPAPGTRHQRVSMKPGSALDAHVTTHRLGVVFAAPIEVILSNTTIVQPDLVYIADERSRIISERGIEGAPTLAVEILSPSTTQTDRRTKLKLYARHAVPYYWIVDVDARCVDVHQLNAGTYSPPARHTGPMISAPPPFPGLALDAGPSGVDAAGQGRSHRPR